jgi:hypothetical protein
MSRFTVDTNILINLNRHYPRDIFPGPWSAIETLIDEGRLCMCPDVLEELSRGGDDLHAWARRYDNFVCEVTEEEVMTVTQLSSLFPDWVRDDFNAADPWLVAHASAERRTIVSEEKRAGDNVSSKNQKVPNVGATLGVDTVNFFALARREAWSF